MAKQLRTLRTTTLFMSTLIGLIGLSVLSGCSEFAISMGGDRIRAGVAQLSVSNAGAVVSMLNRDDTCGFGSEAAKETAMIEGLPGEQGSITISATCTFTLGASTVISQPDCNGNGGQIAGGSIVIRGTQTRYGLVTGAEDAPIIPAGPESVLINIEADYDNFYVQGDQGKAQNYLMWAGQGTVSFSVQPRLAESTDPGAPGICAAVTGNSLLSDIRFHDATEIVLVTDGFFQPIRANVEMMEVRQAFNGRWSEGIENKITGTISLNGVIKELDQDLVPEGMWDGEEFFTGWSSCDPKGYPEDPNVRKVKIVETTGLPNYECVSEVPPARLADGAARLTVSTFAQVVQLIQADTECGFASSLVENAAVTDSSGAGRGKVTYTVTDCLLSFPLDTVVSSDCQGVQTKVSGAVLVSGTFSLEGRLTGDVNQPVLPLSPDAAFIDLTDISFDYFTVRGGRTEAITFRTGSFAGSLAPRLAMGESTGACSVPTQNVLMENLRFTAPADVRIAAPQGQFDADITAGSFRAVNGEYGDEMDAFAGSITIGGEEVAVPAPGEHPGLVPGFDLDAHRESMLCTPDLMQPIQYDGCDAVEAELISGAARLSVNHLGALASMLQADTDCGFAAPAVIDAVQTAGDLGRRGGSATWTVTDCTLNFPEPTVISTNCVGQETIVEGSVTASGTMTLAGWLGAPDNSAEPIVPDSWTPATLDLSFDLDNFTVRGASEQSLTVRQGVLTGTIQPQTAIDSETGACSIATSNARLSNIGWGANTQLRVNAGKVSIDLDVGGATLTAVNGRLEGQENRLEGSITIGGESFTVPYGPNETEANRLVPDYNYQDHLDGFSCKENMVMPASSDECSFYKVIGEGAARLVIQAMGEAAGAINSDTTCGFGNTLGILRNSDQMPAAGVFGDMGTLTFYTDFLLDEFPDGCPLVFDGAEPSSSNCVGSESYVDGTLTVRSTRVVAGELECAFNLFGCIATGIIPGDNNEVDVMLDAVKFTDFSQWSFDANGNPGPGVLTIPDGQATGRVFPILGAQADDEVRFMVATPIAYLRDIEFAANEVTLEAEGRTFKFTIDATDLNAFNGSWAGDAAWNQAGDNASLFGYPSSEVFSEGGPYENFIEGSITVDGNVLTLARQGLDPGFTKQGFEDAYNCEETTPNLLTPVPQAP